MNIKKNILTPLTVSLVTLLSPVFVLAADTKFFPVCECCSSPTPCSVKDFFVVVDKIIDAALYLSFFIAVIMIIKGGVTILLGAGKPAEVTKGRETVTWAIWGMVIAFGAWLIVNTVLTVFTGEGISGYLNF